MNLYECVKGAVNQLLGSKLRTFLTMLGMFIGIGSVILVLSIGAGVKGMVLGTFEDVGKGAVSISAKGSGYELMINQEDLQAIMDLPEVREAILLGDNTYTSIKDYKGDEKMMLCQGVPYNLDVVQSLKIEEGRMYSEQEERAKANVAVVSSTYTKSVLGLDNPEAAIGREIEVKLWGENHTFEIVGLVKAITFPGMPEEMMPLTMYIPFTVMDQIVGFGDERSFSGAIMVEEDFNPSEVAYQVGRLLDKRHNTRNGYMTQSASELIDQMDTVLSVVTGFISLVAAISLLVGGIGIMNIMLVTVKERTREIGIRKAVGATNSEILQQFLVEAIILTVIGGIIGMFLGYFGGLAIGAIFGLEVNLTADMIIFAVGVSSTIGIIFGVYPARQAAKLDPVEALRYE